MPLHRLLREILAHYEFHDVETGEIEGMIDGYVVDNVMSARDAIEPLARAFAFDALDAGDKLQFLARRNTVFAPLDPARCVEEDPGRPLYTLRRMQETELPAAVKLTYIKSGRDYRQAAVEEIAALDRTEPARNGDCPACRAEPDSGSRSCRRHAVRRMEQPRNGIVRSAAELTALRAGR